MSRPTANYEKKRAFVFSDAPQIMPGIVVIVVVILSDDKTYAKNRKQRLINDKFMS